MRRASLKAFNVDSQAACWHHALKPAQHLAYIHGVWQLDRQQNDYYMMQVGFPVMIKATAGGGGRGMRLAMEEGEFMRLLQQAQQEAESAFGNPDMYLERFVNNPRHIEFQVQPHRQSSSCTRTVKLSTAFGFSRYKGSLNVQTPFVACEYICVLHAHKSHKCEFLLHGSAWAQCAEQRCEGCKWCRCWLTCMGM